MQKSFKTSSFTSLPPLVVPLASNSNSTTMTTTTTTALKTETPNPIITVSESKGLELNKPIRVSLDANGNERQRRVRKTSLTSAKDMSQPTLTLGGFARTLLEKANEESGANTSNDDELSPNSIRQLMFFQRTNPKHAYHPLSFDPNEKENNFISSDGSEKTTQRIFATTTNFTDSALATSVSSMSVMDASDLSVGSNNQNNFNNKVTGSGGSGSGGNLSTVLENSEPNIASSSSSSSSIAAATSAPATIITTSSLTAAAAVQPISSVVTVPRKFDQVIVDTPKEKYSYGITIRQKDNKYKPSPPLMLAEPAAPLKCAAIVPQSILPSEIRPRHKAVAGIASGNKYATIHGTPKGFPQPSFFDDNNVNIRNNNTEPKRYPTLIGTPKNYPVPTYFDDNNIRSTESRRRATTKNTTVATAKTTTVATTNTEYKPYLDWDLGFESVQGKHFLIIKTLGKGGSGEVFLVVEQQKKDLFAMKKVSLAGINDTVIKECVNEIQMLQALKGTDLVIRIESWEINKMDRTMKIIMEYGHSDLGASLKASKFSLHEVRSTWESILKIVRIIHSKGIVHSDLKPANFVWVGNRLKIIDFGIASRLQNENDTSIITLNPKGTINYISPETINADELTGRVKIGPKSDIWSLGIILYLLVYGKTPFQDFVTIASKVSAIITGNVHYPPLPPEFEGSGVDSVLRSCLVVDHRQRPSASELLRHPFLPGPS